MTNPFQVPDTLPGSREPLCPWRAEIHRDYYADVDSTGTAYLAFTEQMRPFEQLAQRGRLVVMRGETGCGKTSLIHRCADLLDTELNPPPVDGRPRGDFIVDLTSYRYRKERSQQSRLVEVCFEVLRYLRDRNRIAIPAEWLDRLHRAGDDPYHVVSDMYRELAGCARDQGFVLIILLPPVKDYVNDLHEYSHQADNRERLVFFTESTWVSMIDEFLEGERRSGRATIGLAVRPIDERDGFTFAQSRLGKHPHGSVATADQATIDRVMTSMVQLRASVRMIHNAFYSAWNRYPSSARIETADILESMIEEQEFQRRSGAREGTAR